MGDESYGLGSDNPGVIEFQVDNIMSVTMFTLLGLASSLLAYIPLL